MALTDLQIHHLKHVVIDSTTNLVTRAERERCKSEAEAILAGFPWPTTALGNPITPAFIHDYIEDPPSRHLWLREADR